MLREQQIGVVLILRWPAGRKSPRKTIYKHDDLIPVIDQYRHQPATDNPAATESSGGRETSIIAALRHRFAAKDAENKQLKATVAEQQVTIELLYGQFESTQQIGTRPAAPREPEIVAATAEPTGENR